MWIRVRPLRRALAPKKNCKIMRNKQLNHDNYQEEFSTLHITYMKGGEVESQLFVLVLKIYRHVTYQLCEILSRVQ